MRLGQRWFELNGAPELAERRPGVTFGEPGQALGVMRLGELRLNPQRFVELDNRFRWILIAKQLDSAQVVRFGGTLRPGNPDAEQQE